MRGETIMLRVYSIMLCAYPRSFRQEYGDDMVLVFRDCLYDARRHDGWWGVLFLWLHIMLDWFATVIKQHLLESGVRSAEMVDTTEFDNQLVSSVEYMTYALRSGYSVMQVFEMLAEKAPEPTASEFKRVVEGAKNGQSLTDALDEMRQRVASQKLDQVVDVMLKQKDEGGNLADKLDVVNAELGRDDAEVGWAEHHEDYKAWGVPGE